MGLVLVYLGGFVGWALEGVGGRGEESLEDMLPILVRCWSGS